MSWRACFLDGPLAGREHDRRFAAPEISERLWLAQVPDDDGRLGSLVWSVVGRVPGGRPPAGDWPGMVEYVLDPELSETRPQPPADAFAVFRLAAG